MINVDVVTKENIKENNPILQQIPDHPSRILSFFFIKLFSW